MAVLCKILWRPGPSTRDLIEFGGEAEKDISAQNALMCIIALLVLVHSTERKHLLVKTTLVLWSPGLTRSLVLSTAL